MGHRAHGAYAAMSEDGARVKQRLWLAVAVFAAVTIGVDAILWWLQVRLDIAWWVFSLTSFAPAVGAAVTLLLRRPLDLPAVWRPGFALNAQSIRRTVLMLGLGAGLVLAYTQLATMLKWPLRPLNLDAVPYPFALPGDRSTLLLLTSLAYFIMAGFEELGWRALLQPTLRQRYGVFTTGLVIGLIWSVATPTLFVRALGRWELRPVGTEVALFVIAYVAAQVGLSWLIALGQQRMKYGHWLSAVAIRWVLLMGLFLILDEELGRWQPMSLIAFVLWLFSAVGFFYHWRSDVLRWWRERRAARAASV